MASRVIEIRRIPVGRQDKIYPDSKKSIGSVLTKSGEVATGLTNEEVRKYMPDIINADIHDQNFRAKVDAYFKSLTLRPTKENPLVLEVGLDGDGKPINVLDYIHFKFACQHPKLAVHPTKIKPGITMFVVYDKEEELKVGSEQLEFRRKAYKEFIKLLDDQKKLNIVLTVLADRLGYGVRQILTVDEREVKLKLEKFVQDEPKIFNDVVTDPKLEMKAFIENCITVGVLNRVGTAIINGDQKLGSTQDEAILFLQDKANSDVLVTLKARLEEFTKAK